MYSVISGSIKTKHPVILFATDMILYTLNDDGTISESVTELYWYKKQFHYVTITGIIEIDSERYLKVQTWGGVKYIKFEDIYNSIDARIYYSY